MRFQIIKIEEKLFRSAGFTILESILAIFLITVGIIGAYTLITQTISSARFSSDKLVASYLAQEGIEIVRNIRDTNWLEDRSVDTPWDDGLTGCSTGCEADYDDTQTLSPYNGGNPLNFETTGLYGYDSGTATKFKRKITIEDGPVPGESLNIKVEVFWQEHKFEAQENLYNWK